LGHDQAGREELKRLTDEAHEIAANYALAHKDDPEARRVPYFDRLYPVLGEVLHDYSRR
jgi:hypothetical protein